MFLQVTHKTSGLKFLLNTRTITGVYQHPNGECSIWCEGESECRIVESYQQVTDGIFAHNLIVDIVLKGGTE